MIHVSKSEQPVEWIPIANQDLIQDQDSKMSSSDTSSDSSSDEDEANIQASLDELLETQIKEENEPKMSEEVKLEIPKAPSDEEDIEWEDESEDELEAEEAKFEVSEEEENDEGIDDSDYVPQPRKSGRKKRGRPRKIDSPMEDSKENILDNTDVMLDFQDDLQYTEKATKERQIRKLKPARLKENKNILNQIQSSSWGSQVNLSCQVCEEPIEAVQKAYEHMQNTHSSENSLTKVQCIQCPQEVQGYLQFQIHLWRHFHVYEPPKRGRKKGSSGFWYERKIWTCRDCPVQDSLLEGLQAYIDHLELVHGSDPNCPVCYEAFDDLQILKEHLAIHNKEKPTCQLCSKTFFNNNKLRRHLIEVHEGRKNYMCKECGKCFAR